MKHDRNGRYLIVTLGCFRNEVESDLIRGALEALGMDETSALERADIVVVNTCGFISEACDEGIDTILELDEEAGRLPDRPPILVVGCMAQRYGKNLIREMPEIDACLGTDWRHGLAASVSKLLEGRNCIRSRRAPGVTRLQREVDSSDNAILYVRVADGCDRGCLFCTIPSIRGPFSSVPPEKVCEEIRRLAGEREREVVLLAQDLASYGRDIGGGTDLPSLVRSITVMPEVRWLRLLYLQPEGVTEELLDEVTDNPVVCDYFDIPFQHASAAVLRRMGRPGGAREHLELIRSVRRRSPEAGLRTTVMVGYPGESEEEFEELVSFVEEARFDWMGAFVFSPEEGTPAGRLPARVPAEVAVSRYNRVLEVQERIEESGLSRFDGRIMEVVVDGDSELDGYDLVGRSYREAPVVDGVVHLRCRGARSEWAAQGQFGQALITGREGLDLAGEI